MLVRELRQKGGDLNHPASDADRLSGRCFAQATRACGQQEHRAQPSTVAQTSAPANCRGGRYERGSKPTTQTATTRSLKRARRGGTCCAHPNWSSRSSVSIDVAVAVSIAAGADLEACGSEGECASAEAFAAMGDRELGV